MINLDHLEALKNLPQERPFPGVCLVTIRERPLIKTMAVLTGTWEQLVQAVAAIKAVSSGPDATRSGTALLFDLDHLRAQGGSSSWLLIDAMAINGKLAHITAVCAVSEEGSEALCRDFGLGLMDKFKERASAIKDATILYKEDFQ